MNAKTKIVEAKRGEAAVDNEAQREGAKDQRQTEQVAEGTLGTDEVSGGMQAAAQVRTEPEEVKEPPFAEVVVQLRERFSEKPTTNAWWACVDLVEKREGKERELLQGYLLKHARSNESWNRCRVPCGDWEKTRAGWKFCEVTSQPVFSLPDAVEVYCPPGTYRMGAPPENKKPKSTNKPAREVTLTRGFWTLSTPVTQAMYEAVTGDNPSRFEGAMLPVHSVNWFDAVRFCNQLSEQAGLTSAYEFHGEEEVEWLQDADGYRLPTEAEWEYLCRAGNTSDRYGDLDKVAWHRGNSGRETHPVGQKEPNAWGLFDTLGSVYEWCMDEWDKEAYSTLPLVDPAYVPHRVDERVLRGGSRVYNAGSVRASFRVWNYAGTGGFNQGFRIVRTSRAEIGTWVWR